MNINILGAGAFGTALALVFYQKHHVRLITLPKYLKELEFGYNSFLPDVKIPPSIDVHTEIDPSCDVLFSVTPAQTIDDTTHKIAQLLPAHTPVVFCSKGLYVKDQKPYLMTDYAQTKLKNPLYALGGPNFAHEMAAFQKSYATVAGPDADKLCKELSQDHFILEPWHDVCGVQVAGCMKSVFAIASGYYEGMKKCFNERAALFTMAFSEMIMLGQTFWGDVFDEASLLTHAGVGDLVLACTNIQSRNYKFGVALASGMTFENFKKQYNVTVEGVYTAQALHAIKGKLELPICDMIYEHL